MGNKVSTILSRIFYKKKSQQETHAMHKKGLQTNDRNAKGSRINKEKKPGTSSKAGHTSKKESQEDHIEMMGLVGECGVSMSMIVDGDRSVMTCSIRSHPNNGMHDNQKGMLGKRDKCLMPLTRVLRPTSGESKLRLEQLRKDSPPQTLFRIKGRVSTYDTFRFQSRSQSSKKHYCMGLNLFSLKTEQPVDLGEAETGNDEDCDLELQETLTIAAIRKSDPSKNFPSVSQQSTESKSEME